MNSGCARRSRTACTRCSPGTAIRHGYTDLFGKRGSEFLAALELREPPRRRLETLLALICDFDREIGVATGEIDALAKHDARVDVLCQIRGIGRYTAMLVIAEVGDISRFARRASCAPGPA